MSTNPNALAFVAPSTATSSRALGDHIGGHVFNVKSFGAYGDNGIHDDTVAIQACLDAAFIDNIISPGFNPWCLNTRLVYFPAGIYQTHAELLIPLKVHGGMIYGDGMGVSVINNVTSGSIVINAGQGLLNSTLRDISLRSAGGAGSICYKWDEPPASGGGQCKENCWINVEFQGAERGLQAGPTSQCDNSLLVNCRFKNHSIAGVQFRSGNVINWTFQGGRFESCNVGLSIAAGGVVSVLGVHFLNNTTDDIENIYAFAVLIVGCYSESSPSEAFLRTNGPAKIIGTTFTGTGNFVFLTANLGAFPVVGTTAVCLDACASPSGTFISGSGWVNNTVYARGCSFTANAFTPFAGVMVIN